MKIFNEREALYSQMDQEKKLRQSQERSNSNTRFSLSAKNQF